MLFGLSRLSCCTYLYGVLLSFVSDFFEILRIYGNDGKKIFTLFQKAYRDASVKCKTHERALKNFFKSLLITIGQ